MPTDLPHSEVHPVNEYTIENVEHGIVVRDLRTALRILESRLPRRRHGCASCGAERFEACHRGCWAGDARAFVKAARARLASHVALDRWLDGTDTGMSSLTIVWALTGRGGGRLEEWGPMVPADPSDFGRCFRLLETVPGLRERLPEVAAKHPIWGPFVDAWPELEALWREESPSGNCPRLYARMRQINDASRKLRKVANHTGDAS